MKTDRFSDIIRRKLESIRPEFTDKDWTRMQASLQQAMPPQPGSPTTGTPFSGGVWSGSPWLLAAASVSTVVLIAFSLWQRSEINTLRETVGQLKQQSVATQPAPASITPNRSALSTLDSQYRSQPAPQAESDIQANQPLPGNQDTVASTGSDALLNSGRQETTDERATQQMDSPPKQRDVIANRTSVSVGDARTQTKSSKNLKTDKYGASSTPLTINQPSSTPSAVASEPVRQSASAQPKANAETRSQTSEPSPVKATDDRNGAITNRNSYARNPLTTTQAGSPSNSYGQSAKPTQQPQETTAPVSDRAGMNPSEPAVTTGTEASETYKLATSLPLSLPDRDWNSALVKRAIRMRLVQPPAPVATQPVARAVNAEAPASQPVTPLAARPRVGVGSDVDAHMWSVGAFSEIQLNKHWALSVGLSKATYLGGLFITASDFDNRTHRNFQKEFGRGLNPKLDPQDILNIDTRVQRFQIPLSLSYRIPLGRTLALLPTVGTYVNLSSVEKADFYFRDSPRGFDQASFKQSRPVDLLNTVTLGTSLEWQSRHWVLQGSPLLVLPLTSDSDWQKSTMLGLRARVFYQF
ncbi:hypothetical protein [Spirosoma luteum]|uniref:hypothetical protein n=1 Tax=Spirosoma luteum TaxID=431553 RepID=UPI00035EA5A4|nr:hypothetical protein [Spirosoma luteum]